MCLLVFVLEEHSVWTTQMSLYVYARKIREKITECFMPT